MPIPTYQQAMLPALQVLADGIPRPRSVVVAAVAELFNLTETERVELLQSGKATVISSRVGWAITYLKQAGLVATPKRGIYTITDRGREILSRNPSSISVEDLDSFAEFRDFIERARASQGNDRAASERTTEIVDTEVSPDEAIEEAYERIRAEVESELLTSIKAGSPLFFEHLVVDLLVRMGYGGSHRDAARAVGRPGDGGIDGMIDEDQLGLDTIYIQAKRWEGVVGRPEVQKFAGALQGHRARKGIMLTTSSFSKEAHDFVDRIDARIILIDGDRLATLCFDHGIGVSVRTTYAVKQIDSDYFEGE